MCNTIELIVRGLIVKGLQIIFGRYVLDNGITQLSRAVQKLFGRLNLPVWPRPFPYFIMLIWAKLQEGRTGSFFLQK